MKFSVNISGQWVGLAAKCSGECSLSTLAPVGGFGSEICGEHFGPVGGLGSEFVGGIFAKYCGGNERGLAAIFSVEFSLSTLGPVGGLGSNIFGEIVAKYFGARGWAWLRNCSRNFR